VKRGIGRLPLLLGRGCLSRREGVLQEFFLRGELVSDPSNICGPEGYRLLYDLGRAFAECRKIDELVELVVERCREVFHADGVSVLALDETAGELYFPWAVASDEKVAARLADLRFAADKGVAGAVLESGKGIFVADVASDPRWYSGIDDDSGLATHSILAAPLVSHRGNAGVLEVINPTFDGAKGEHGQVDESLLFLESLAGSVAVALENAGFVEALQASERSLRTRADQLQRDIARRDRFLTIAGNSRAMQSLFDEMETVAASPITVLIQGETGTGKELVARAIHNEGERADGPFLAVNCSAFPETLLESQLFGHARGSFTGADRDKAGLFEAAAGGTLFLDEVGEMPATMQPKLLRVLQEGEILRVGDTKPRDVDVRVLAATNRDLKHEVDEGRFREDLYYRLAVFPLTTPPLRERREDIPLIVATLLERVSQRHGKKTAGLADEVMQALVAAEWEGNVRELENEIERAVALTPAGETVTLARLSARVAGREASAAGAGAGVAAGVVAGGAAASLPLREARRAFERDYVARVLQRNDDNVTRAAEDMEISRVALQKKLKDLGLR